MSTTLEITFRCMCLFVPEPGTRRTHVLMPSTTACAHGDHGNHGDHDGHPTHAVDRHVVKLVFPMKGGRLSADGESFAQNRRVDGKLDFRDMAGWSLVLPRTRAAAPAPGVSVSSVTLPDLRQATGSRVSRALLNGTRDRRVAARVTLNGGAIVAHDAAAVWNFDGQSEIPMAQEVTWRLEGLPDGPLQLTRVRLGAGPNPGPRDVNDLPLLHPENGVIALRVLHVMDTDFPTPQVRLPQDTSRHFQAFYCLFDQPTRTPLPEFVRQEQVGVIGCLAGTG
jgi:hypothetical protein